MFLPIKPAEALIPVYHWLAGARVSRSEAPALILEHLGGKFSPLAQEIASHLAQYDDAGDGGWLCLDEATVEMARTDVAIRALLGMDDTTEIPLVDFLPALVSHGGVIVEKCLTPKLRFAPATCFHVAIVPAGKFQPPGFHLAADPEKFTPSCLVAIIGDTFLEWVHNRAASPAPEDTNAA